MLATWGCSTFPQASLDLNFLLSGNVLDNRITFTRATPATFFGSNGLLQTASSGQARFDYNPSTLALRGLLIEQSSTNIALWSRDMTNAAWVKVNTTAALDQTGIDGTANSASSLLATGGNATTLQTIVHVSSTDTYSVSIKRLVGTGEIDITTDGVTWTNVTTQINSLSFTRVSVTQAAVTNPAIGIRIVTNGDKVAVDYNQSEVLGFATSPILTTNAIVVRNADVPTIATSAFGFNPNAGTLFAQVLEGSFVSASQIFLSASNGTAAGADRYVLLNQNSAYRAVAIASASTKFDISGGTITAGSLTKIVLGQDASTAALASQGTLRGTATPTGQPSGIDRFTLGANQDGTLQINGWLQQVKYWPRRLSNGQLQVLTA